MRVPVQPEILTGKVDVFWYCFSIDHNCFVYVKQHTAEVTPGHVHRNTRPCQTLMKPFTFATGVGRKPTPLPPRCIRQHVRSGQVGMKQQRTDDRPQTASPMRAQPFLEQRIAHPASSLQTCSSSQAQQYLVQLFAVVCVRDSDRSVLRTIDGKGRHRLGRRRIS